LSTRRSARYILLNVLIRGKIKYKFYLKEDVTKSSYCCELMTTPLRRTEGVEENAHTLFMKVRCQLPF
jgi:hypothetical protein